MKTNVRGIKFLVILLPIIAVSLVAVVVESVWVGEKRRSVACDLDVFARLKAESYAYAKFFESNCSNEVQLLLSDTNAVSPRIFHRQDVSGVGEALLGASATNAEFAVWRLCEGWRFSFITIAYSDGSRLNANFSKRGISQIHWIPSRRKGQFFEIHVGEEGLEKVLSYNFEPVGEGDEEDIYLSNIRQYEGGRLLREYPPCSLGEMIFESKMGRLSTSPSAFSWSFPSGEKGRGVSEEGGCDSPCE